MCRSGEAGVERWQIMLSGRDTGEMNVVKITV